MQQWIRRTVLLMNDEKQRHKHAYKSRHPLHEFSMYVHTQKSNILHPCIVAQVEISC